MPQNARAAVLRMFIGLVSTDGLSHYRNRLAPPLVADLARGQ